jgi:hypothetical protein
MSRTPSFGTSRRTSSIVKSGTRSRMKPKTCSFVSVPLCERETVLENVAVYVNQPNDTIYHNVDDTTSFIADKMSSEIKCTLIAFIVSKQVFRNKGDIK